MAELSNVRSGFKSVAVTGAKTLTAADSGIVQDVQASATITLPATAAGLTFPIQVGVASATSALPTVTIAPNAADGVTGNGFTAAVNKAIVAAAATARYGDLIVLRGTGTTGVTGWIVDTVIGTWNRAA
jgi:hypothetical protein